MGSSSWKTDRDLCFSHKSDQQVRCHPDDRSHTPTHTCIVEEISSFDNIVSRSTMGTAIALGFYLVTSSSSRLHCLPMSTRVRRSSEDQRTAATPNECGTSLSSLRFIRRSLISHSIIGQHRRRASRVDNASESLESHDFSGAEIGR